MAQVDAGYYVYMALPFLVRRGGNFDAINTKLDMYLYLYVFPHTEKHYTSQRPTYVWMKRKKKEADTKLSFFLVCPRFRCRFWSIECSLSVCVCVSVSCRLKIADRQLFDLSDKYIHTHTHTTYWLNCMTFLAAPIFVPLLFVEDDFTWLRCDSHWCKSIIRGFHAFTLLMPLLLLFLFSLLLLLLLFGMIRHL